MKSTPHLLLMPPNWIGDVIMAQPALRAITEFHTQHGTEKITVCGRPWLKELLPYLGLENAQYQPVIPTADTAFLFPNSFRSAWQCRQAGIKNIIGYRGQWRSLLLSKALDHRIDTLHEHHRNFHLDIARQMNIPVNNSEVTLSPPADSKRNGQEIMRRHGVDSHRAICIAPGAQFGAAKRYPPEGFHRVVRQLSDAGWQPIVLGMQEDHTVGQQVLHGITTTHWNAAGATNMTEALQLISASRLMLCNDSGLMHIAAGLGIPTVTPFGATDPARTSPSGPYLNILYHPADCSPCLQRECSVKGHPCMANITSDLLFDACLSMLKDTTLT